MGLAQMITRLGWEQKLHTDLLNCPLSGRLFELGIASATSGSILNCDAHSLSITNDVEELI